MACRVPIIAVIICHLGLATPAALDPRKMRSRPRRSCSGSSGDGGQRGRSPPHLLPSANPAGKFAGCGKCGGREACARRRRRSSTFIVYKILNLLCNSHGLKITRSASRAPRAAACGPVTPGSLAAPGADSFFLRDGKEQKYCLKRLRGLAFRWGRPDPMFSPRSSSKPKPQCEMLCERKKKKNPTRAGQRGGHGRTVGAKYSQSGRKK